MEMESSLSFMTFKGSATEAISEAKKQKKLFVVYISGDDADTSSLERFTWRSLNVVQFVSKYCIFLHLPAETADGLPFSATHSQKAIPSITVVGFEGVKLWEHAGYIDPKDLASSLEEARLASIEDKMEEHQGAEGVGRKTKDESKTVNRIEKFNDVHLKIRLVNGSSLQEKFSPTTTLLAVKEYVDKNQAADFGSYDLAIPHPIKVFDNRELSKSLTELGLFDRQTLVVVPHRRPESEGKSGYFGFAKWVLSYANPFAYLGAAAASSSNSEQESQTRTLEHGPSTSRKRSNSGPESSRSSPDRSSSVGRRGQGPATSRWGSNIHTLQLDGDDDERFRNRNAFWNGNSTLYGGDNGEAK